jgi:hypothetical protein
MTKLKAAPESLPPLLLDYKPADRTLAQMHNSTSAVRVVVGPRGSGKTSSAICELFRHARMMPPGKDGVRRSKALVIRGTYPSLVKTTLASVDSWLSGVPGYHTRHSTPPTTRVNTQLDDGTTLDFEIQYMALPDIPSLQGVRGTEFSFCWADEFVELPIEVLAAVSGSLGRYPSRNSFATEHTVGTDGRPIEPFTPFIIMTTNPASEGSLWHKWVDNPTEGVEVFTQVGAWAEYTPQQAEVYLKHNPELRPHSVERWGYWYVPEVRATYVRCISSGYAYWKKILMAAADRSEALMLVCARWATSKSGKPCWPGFDEALHFSKEELEPVPHLPVYVGLDQSGLHPACVICQMVGPSLIIYESLSPSDETGGTGLDEFLTDSLMPALQARYNGMRIEVVLDPQIARDHLTARTCVERLLDFGLGSKPAPTNDPKMRLDSVAKRLTRKAGIVVSRSEHTSHILKALRGGHHFARRPDGTHSLSPDKKSVSSHVADALGYASVHLDIAGRTGSATAGKSSTVGRGLLAR